MRSAYPTLIMAQYNNGRCLRHHFICRLDCLELHIPSKYIPRRMICYRILKYHLFVREWPQINHPAPICHTWYPSSCLLFWSPNLPKISRIHYRGLRIQYLWGLLFVFFKKGVQAAYFIYQIMFCSQNLLLFKHSVCIHKNQMVSFWSLARFDLLRHTLTETELDRYLKSLY